MQPIEDEDLVIHVLNVGFGDTTIIEFPAEPDVDNAEHMVRSYALVDCRDAVKTRKYLQALAERRPSTTQLKFLCATHPHSDHISGIRAMILDECFTPREFWDSGFRHSSQCYRGILMALKERNVPLARVGAGMDQQFGSVRLTALAPSATLRSQFDSSGVGIDNASIVLRLENQAIADAEQIGEAAESTMILASDAQIESWAQIAREYSLSTRDADLLACRALKVAHHGSLHGSAREIYERMCPALAILSTKQEREPARGRALHPSTELALEELGAKLLTTDGSTERRKRHDPENAREGSVVVVIPPGGSARWRKLGDREHQVPEVVDVV
jgi:beta-lactamase superfamily II metal-dependent hydrolase